MTRAHGRFEALALVAVVVAGCAASPAAGPAAPVPHPVVEAPTVFVSPYTEEQLAQQFEHARTLLLADRFAEAKDVFDRLARIAPDDKVAPLSTFNASVAREGLGERAAAVEGYRAFLKTYSNHEMAKAARLRLVRVLAYLERWEELAVETAPILAYPDLTVLEAIEAEGLEGLGLVEQDKLDEATKHVLRARDLVEQHRIGDGGRPPIETAATSFAIAEVRRKKSETITFEPMPANFSDALERRCTGLLDAQRAYVETMRNLDAHWSAMAGYRVGQLYQRLHHDVMRVPPPAVADNLKRQQLFEGAMRLRYRVLLEKGLAMMTHTVALGERTGETSDWVQRARDAKRDLDLALQDERAAMAKLPFTEAELTEALELLKTRSSASGASLNAGSASGPSGKKP